MATSSTKPADSPPRFLKLLTRFHKKSTHRSLLRTLMHKTQKKSSTTEPPRAPTRRHNVRRIVHAPPSKLARAHAPYGRRQSTHVPHVPHMHMCHTCTCATRVQSSDVIHDVTTHYGLTHLSRPTRIDPDRPGNLTRSEPPAKKKKKKKLYKKKGKRKCFD